MLRQPVILIVDDEQHVLSALYRLFNGDLVTVHAAECPHKALSLLKKYPVDLVLSDEKMPGMSGVEFLKKVKEHYPDIVRIMLTGNAQLDTAMKAVNEGEVYRFLTKPWSPEELRALILKALKQAELEKENRSLLEETRRRQDACEHLERNHPGITDVTRDENGNIIIPKLEGI